MDLHARARDAARSNDLASVVAREFEVRFGAQPNFIARAPGRVNLIGDHTDYNDGFVLPMAIDRATWIAARPRADRRVVLHSLDFETSASFELGDSNRRDGEWSEYVRGVAWAIQHSGREIGQGWEGVSAGNVPVGAGLSSSASFELAVARVFAAVAGIPWEPAFMARAAQRAENDWVGVNCGIMDQLISAAGIAGHALLIDCRSLASRAVPIPASCTVVVLDTATRRGLVDSEYNERRAQCDAAARFFDVPSLRDVSEQSFEALSQRLDPVIRRRARHVVTENARTISAATALECGNLESVGRSMAASHASLRDDFEVSRRELDLVVKIAEHEDACFGARMTGAGFGGCAVAIVESAGIDQFTRDVARDYEKRAGLSPSVYVCAASEGATLTER
jgi:galactokinase